MSAATNSPSGQESSGEHTDLEHMVRILDKEGLGNLGLSSGNEPYVVPINYCYAQGRILLHCALEGRKLDIIRENPKVCFVVSRQEGQPAPHDSGACNHLFESVICYGSARIVDDLDERCGLLEAFQRRYSTPANPRSPMPPDRAARCACVAIDVTEMTGRRRSATENVAWHWNSKVSPP